MIPKRPNYGDYSAEDFDQAMIEHKHAVAAVAVEALVSMGHTVKGCTCEGCKALRAISKSGWKP